MVIGGFGIFARSGRAFGRDRRGNVAMMWALMGAVLLGLVGMSVDFTRAQMIRSQLQNAADGAALAAARMTQGTTMTARTTAARAYFDSEAGSLATGATFNLVDIGSNGFRVDVSEPMDLSLARLVSNQPWTIAVSSEAARGGMNLEVALVLDTTGSMSGQRITDLRNSAGDLVDILFATPQVPYYTKIGLITWGMGVNAGSYATAARGAIPAARTITAAAWQNGATSTNISAATKASPVVITSNNHGLNTGDTIWISGVSGMTQINNRAFLVSKVDNNKIQLRDPVTNANINGSSYSTYTSGGTIRRCLEASCQVRVTSNSHGFANNAWVYITGVNGMTQINSSGDTAWQVTNVQSNTFALVGSVGPNYTAYTSSGSAWCTTLGCQYYRFTNASNAIRILQISSCVSERVNNDVATDAAPSTTPVGYNYASSGNPCDTGTGVIPMTTDAAPLHARINSLGASGSTAGQVGTAWGWYLLSPNWGYMWPAVSRGAAYGTPETQKIAVLMTDGAFNSAYCNGVIAQNSLSGSGSNTDHINCNATNGASASQTIAICNSMKARGIIVYTVGFHIDNDATALNVFHSCATDDAHFFLADDGVTLQHAFQQIGQSISQLRLTH
jgi:Flp pilus assembly protein TadG